jgi:hypothetical protein
MKNEWPIERFNDKNAERAFAAIAKSSDFELIKWKLLRRYAEVRQLFFSTDPGVVNRAIGKVEEIEKVLELFGAPLYGGLPLADGTPDEETVKSEEFSGTKIGDGYPDGFGSRSSL